MADWTDAQARSLAELAYTAAHDDAADRGLTATEAHRHGLQAVVSAVRTMLAERGARDAAARIDAHREGWAGTHPSPAFGEGLQTAVIIARELQERP